MYVTDVPVIDRLTDPILGPLWSAAHALDGALDDLAGWSEEAQGQLTGQDVGTEYYAPTPESIAKGLSEATDASLTAHGELFDALHLLRPTTL